MNGACKSNSEASGALRVTKSSKSIAKRSLTFMHFNVVLIGTKPCCIQ